MPAGVFARLAAEAALGRPRAGPAAGAAQASAVRIRAAADVAALERAILRGPRPKPAPPGWPTRCETFRERARQNSRRKETSACIVPIRGPSLTDAELDAAADSGRATQARRWRRWNHCRRRAADRRPSPRAMPRRLPRSAALTPGARARAFDEIDASRQRSTVAPSRLCRTVPRRDRRPHGPPAAEADVRVRIFGPLEARLQSVDRLVLGGLVEGVWPPETRGDPWLSRADAPRARPRSAGAAHRPLGARFRPGARRARGDPARRAAKLGGAPTVASRFVQRLAAVAGEARWKAALERGARYAALARTLDETEHGHSRHAARRRGRRSRRGRGSSASPRSRTWLRDPYTIYAKHVLKLTPLDEIDTPPGAADRGTVIHDSIGEFAKTSPRSNARRSSRGADRRSASRHFKPLADYPEARAFWWPRFCASPTGSRASKPSAARS